MGKIGLWIGAVVAGVLVPAAVVTGPADAGSQLQVFTHDTHLTALDLGDEGDSAGDRRMIRADVFDREGGTKLGHFGGFCEAVTRDGKGGGDDACSVMFSFEEGQIMTSLLADRKRLISGEALPFVITGGSGKYRLAGGDGTISVLNATDTRIVFKLE